MSSENPIGQPFIHLTQVESTNNYAMAQAQAQMAGHGTAWFADYQTKGKGQRGKVWTGEAGQNIFISILVAPSSLKLGDQFKLSAAVATACCNFFSAYALDETKIKWPNDIYWKDRKAGGILIENIMQGDNWKYAIVGIGININQTSFEGIANAVSLKQITGKKFDALLLAKELCSRINGRWNQVVSGDFEKILFDYNALLYKANQQVVFRKDEEIFAAVVRSVNGVGELLINDGEIIAYGEAQWVLS